MIRTPDCYWSLDGDALAAALDSPARGLAAAEARARLRAFGPNRAEPVHEATALRLFARQFASPLVLILVFGAIASMLVGDAIDAAIILAILALTALLGFGHEYRASRAIALLRRRLALTARVLRDGTVRAIEAASIVPGDRVLLAAGNRVPADAIVVEARDFLVSEAALTGEAFPVEKRPGVVPRDAGLARRTNAVFLGTSVRSGTATVLVARTGRATEFGAIADRLGAAVPETEFARGIRHFGYLLLRVMVVMVLAVLAFNQLLGRPPVESLMFAVALAVGLSPELLPAIVTVTLARGARAMAASGVLLRRLEAIENLGSIDVLCTDKTGTLTAGEMTLEATPGPDGVDSPEVARLAFLNAAFETGIENPLDRAIVAAGAAAGLVTDGWEKLDEIPYDFVRRRLTIVVRGAPGSALVVTKGALREVLDVCTHVSYPRGDASLDASLRAAIEARAAQEGSEGRRVLAVAKREVDVRPAYDHDVERDLAFAGFLVFADPVKPTAAAAVRDLAALGVRVRMLTGDNRDVARHVARAVGLDPQSTLTGAEIARMHDDALARRVDTTALFVEVDPQQKLRVVRALKAGGHAVGYLGDGINDAPSLAVADVGISVHGAVDVARESADVVLLRPDLDVLRRGVEDGRRAFANTLKYVGITTSANFGNMVSMAIATPLLPFLPLVAKQILLNNFLSDIPSVAISTDHVDAERVRRPERWQLAEVRRFMIVFGLVSTLFDLLTFALLIVVFAADERTFRTAWFLVSLATELAVVLVLRTEAPAWRSRPSPALLWTTVVALGVTIAIPYLPGAARVFGFVPIPWPLGAAAGGVVVAYVVATEATKRWFHRTAGSTAPARQRRNRQPR